MLHFILSLALIVQCVSSAAPDVLHRIQVSGWTDRSSYQTMKDLALAYQLVNNDLSLSIEQSPNSMLTTSALTEGTLDFGIGISGWSSAVASAAPSLRMLPMFLSGFAPIYRIDAIGTSVPPIVFSRQAIVAMFTGACTKWSCPLLQSANPLIKLPDQNITMLFDVSGGARNTIIKRALYQFDAAAMANSSMKINNNIDYPFNLYAATLNASTGVTSLVSQVLAVDGSFSFSFYSSALTLGVSIGKMINKANNIVAINEESLTFAAIELGTTAPANYHTAHILTDGASDSAYPLAFFSYLLIDLTRSGGSCRAREYGVKFFLHTLTDGTAINIASNRGLIQIPELILAQTDVIETLSTRVMCRGEMALPTEMTSTRLIGVSPSFLFMFKLFVSVYNDPDTNVAYVPQTAHDNIMVSQLVNSEVDLILVTPTNVEPIRWNALMDSGDYLAIPVFGTAPNIFFNRDIAPKMKLPASSKFLVDYSLLVKILTGCTSNYNDSLLLAQNPWISSITNNASIPIQKVIGCGATADDAPLMTFVWRIVSKITAAGLISSDVLRCFDRTPRLEYQTSLFAQCKSSSEYQLQFTTNEMLAPSLALGTLGGSSVALDDLDPDKLFPTLVQNVDGAQMFVDSNVAGILACADTFNPTTLMFDFSKSSNPGCWPLAQPMVAVVRKQYWSSPSITNSSSCSRGLDALQFLAWLVKEQDVKILTDSINFAQLSTLPGVRDAYMAALNAVLCDNDTLLITLPIDWSLSGALFGFAIAAAAIGLLFTNILILYVMVQFRHPIIRASSPLFMIVSLVGVQLLFVSVIFLTLNATIESCAGLSWLVNLGVMVTFAPLLMRTYRVWRIFGGRKLSVVKYSNRKLMAMVCMLFGIEIVLLSIWQGVGQIEPVVTIQWEGIPPREHHYNQCSTGSSSADTMFGIVAGEKSLLLVVAALLAFSTRRVSAKFNESSNIALAIYNMLFSGGIIAIIIAVIGAIGDVRSALIAFAILWIAFFTAGILVIPKMIHIHGGAEDQGVENKSSSGGFSFMSLDGLDNLPMVGSYLAALRRHIEQVEQRQATLKSKKGGGFNAAKTPSTPSTDHTMPSIKKTDVRLSATYTTTTSRLPIVGADKTHMFTGSQSLSGTHIVSN